jgi:diguanylate cyclase (GGDEF)-like protein/PAS domain S-box-containing protein
MLKLVSTPPDTAPESEPPADTLDLRGVVDRLDQLVYRFLVSGDMPMEFVGGGSVNVTGYLPNALPFTTRAAYAELVMPKDRNAMRAAVEAAQRGGGRFEIDYRIVDDQGNIRWVRERGAAVLDGEGKCCAIEGTIADITRGKRSERELALQKQFFMRMVEHAAEGVFRMTPEGKISYVNRAMAALLGYASRRELVEGVTNFGMQHYVDPGESSEFLKRVRTQGTVADFEVELQRRNGEHFWASISVRAITDREGRLHYFDGCLRDVTRRRVELNELQLAISLDQVIGLPERHTLQASLEAALEDARSRGAPLAVAVANVDAFREVNAALSYATGSQVLRGVASRLASTVRESDTVVHLGGDEFALILPADRKGGGIMGVVQNVLKVATQSFNIEGRKINLTLSVGIAVFPQHADTPDALLARAEDALRNAKKAGRGTFHLFDAEESVAPSKSQEPGSGFLRRLRRLLPT